MLAKLHLYLVSVAALIVGLPALAQQDLDTGITLTIASRQSNLLNLGEPKRSVGHIYIVVGVRTNNGIKEELYGFYPQSNMGIIKGPGMLKSEYRCGKNDDCSPEVSAQTIAKLGAVTQSVTVGITQQQRQLIYTEMNKWNFRSFSRGPHSHQIGSERSFQLWNQNCVAFVSTVARRLGLSSNDSSWTTPENYLNSLKREIEEQRQIREAQHEADRRESEAREQEERIAEAQRREAERLEAERIPVGWVLCNCPNRHSGMGRLIRGLRYHPGGHPCN